MFSRSLLCVEDKVFTQFTVLNEELLSEKNLVDVDRLYKWEKTELPILIFCAGLNPAFSRWWGSLTMVPSGNKAKRLSSANLTTKIIHHHSSFIIIKLILAARLWRLLWRKYSINWTAFPFIPLLSSLYKLPLCKTLSNAFDKSRKNPFTFRDGLASKAR